MEVVVNSFCVVIVLVNDHNHCRKLHEFNKIIVPFGQPNEKNTISLTVS